MTLTYVMLQFRAILRPLLLLGPPHGGWQKWSRIWDYSKHSGDIAVMSFLASLAPVAWKLHKSSLLYLRYALTNPKSGTTFANRHGGVPRVKVVSELL